MAEDLPAKLALVEGLGLELKRLGLDGHVTKLRAYYRDLRAGRAHVGERGWNDAHVIELAKTHRIPPYENAYPIRPRRSSCGCSEPKTYTSGTLPNGSKHTCGACHFTWLELDGPQPLVRDVGAPRGWIGNAVAKDQASGSGSAAPMHVRRNRPLPWA